MSIRSRLIASCAAFAALPAAQGLAADYDPPIIIEQAPEWVPVEIGSGWYLRGDVSYNVGDPVYDFELLGEETSNRRFGGGFGVGYHLSDNFRVDATLAYLGSDRYRYDDGFDFGEASHTAWSGLVNGYWDIATVMGVTPYVGAGVGATYSKHHVSIDSPTLGVFDEWSDRQTNFAYALMAGASYKVSQNASIDVGYQFLHTPGMEYLDTDTFTIAEGVKQHQIKVGLRYDLW